MPNEANAGETTGWGRGLYEATAGEDAEFTVQARDAYGNNRLTEQVNAPGLEIAVALLRCRRMFCGNARSAQFCAACRTSNSGAAHFRRSFRDLFCRRLFVYRNEPLQPTL